MSAPADRLTEAVRAFRSGDFAVAEAACRALLDADPRHGQALHILALIAAQGGRTDDALALAQTAAEAAPDDPSVHNTVGSLLFQAGRVAEAEPAFRRSVAANDRLPESHGNLGNALRALGRLEEAEASLRTALTLRAGAPDLLNNLACTLRDLGRLEEAERLYGEALAAAPDYLEARHNLAEALLTRGALAEAEAEYRAVIAAAPRFMDAWVGLVHALHSQDRAADALAAIDEARTHAPDHPGLEAARRLIHSNAVPAWHLPMINDHERNRAYREALDRAVRPDSLVLEIGTGSGLVALMAARAGARQVVTCEVNPVLARVAVETVARNGYADRVTVVPKLSTRLVVGEDMPEKADVFVSELINIGMLAPRMLAVLQHARTHLVKPGGAIIPRASTVYGMLVETPELARINPVHTVEGFDLSAFDVFRSPGYQPIDLAADAHTPLSEPFTALEFDFTRTMPQEGSASLTVSASADGVAHGVAFWFDLFMDGEVVYHSASRARTNHWKQAISFFSRPLTVAAGDRIALVARYDTNQIGFELAAPKQERR